jgi:hypothetical protein
MHKHEIVADFNTRKSSIPTLQGICASYTNILESGVILPFTTLVFAPMYEI